jgi:Family of unknown function (DUF6152)
MEVGEGPRTRWHHDEAAELLWGEPLDWRYRMTRAITFLAILALITSAAFAHHGWGSYDAAKPVTVAGPIVTSKFENPHATITVKAADKVWTVTLAPTSRMTSRGANDKVIAVGNNISAYGYPSTVEKDEMRAERITFDGKTYEMR